MTNNELPGIIKWPKLTPEELEAFRESLQQSHHAGPHRIFLHEGAAFTPSVDIPEIRFRFWLTGIPGWIDSNRITVLESQGVQDVSDRLGLRPIETVWDNSIFLMEFAANSIMPVERAKQNLRYLVDHLDGTKHLPEPDRIEL